MIPTTYGHFYHQSIAFLVKWKLYPHVFIDHGQLEPDIIITVSSSLMQSRACPNIPLFNMDLTAPPEIDPWGR